MQSLWQSFRYVPPFLVTFSLVVGLPRSLAYAVELDRKALKEALDHNLVTEPDMGQGKTREGSLVSGEEDEGKAHFDPEDTELSPFDLQEQPEEVVSGAAYPAGEDVTVVPKPTIELSDAKYNDVPAPPPMEGTPAKASSTETDEHE